MNAAIAQSLIASIKETTQVPRPLTKRSTKRKRPLGNLLAQTESAAMQRREVRIQALKENHGANRVKLQVKGKNARTLKINEQPLKAAIPESSKIASPTVNLIKVANLKRAANHIAATNRKALIETVARQTAKNRNDKTGLTRKNARKSKNADIAVTAINAQTIRAQGVRALTAQIHPLVMAIEGARMGKTAVEMDLLNKAAMVHLSAAQARMEILATKAHRKTDLTANQKAKSPLKVKIKVNLSVSLGPIRAHLEEAPNEAYPKLC